MKNEKKNKIRTEKCFSKTCRTKVKVDPSIAIEGEMLGVYCKSCMDRKINGFFDIR